MGPSRCEGEKDRADWCGCGTRELEGHSERVWGGQFDQISKCLQWSGVESPDDDRSRGLEIPEQE